MMETEILVVGAGPGGLGAAIEAARRGARVVLADENDKAGGQLYKQIHKFFGSGAHYAGVRGFEIADILLEQAREAGVRILLDSRVNGILDDGTTVLQQEDGIIHLNAKKIILATGAKENALPFPGWTLPGVMTAGSAQTFSNIHGVQVGNRVLVAGSGNVGLIVSYQLMQAGAEIAGIVDVKPKVSGYQVHAGKINRAGVPINLKSTIIEARGDERVREAVIAEVDEKFKPVPETERTIQVDTILLAVGLTPRIDISSMMGCRMTSNGALGGTLPLHDENMLSTRDNIYVCGDLTGIEEANTALDEGRLAGLAAASACGYGNTATASQMDVLRKSLDSLRSGIHDIHRLNGKKEIVEERRAVHAAN